jgi:hypothetical protein
LGGGGDCGRGFLGAWKPEQINSDECAGDYQGTKRINHVARAGPSLILGVNLLPGPLHVILQVQDDCDPASTNKQKADHRQKQFNTDECHAFRKRYDPSVEGNGQCGDVPLLLLCEPQFLIQF